MKVKKFEELNIEPDKTCSQNPGIIEDLTSRIEDIISANIYLRDVPYSMQDGDMEVDPDSITDVAKAIVAELKRLKCLPSIR